MKKIHILPMLVLLSACASGSIFGSKTSETETVAQTPAPTVEEQKSQRVDYVPYLPKRGREATSKQIYTVLASRSVNKVLQATAADYANAKYPRLYVAAPVTEGRSSVPDNPEYAIVVTKDIITGSHSYVLVPTQAEADYVLETYISSNPVVSRGTDIIVYKTVLKDGAENEIGSWVETLSPIMNDDKSWW